MQNSLNQAIPVASRIISVGDLVRIGSCLDIAQENAQFGIIISCTYGFGTTSNEWLVLTQNRLERIDSHLIWSMEDII